MDDNHDFELTYRLINDKINKKAVLTYKEQEFYFEGTKKEYRQNVILLPQMKEDMIYEENKPSFEELINNLEEVKSKLQKVEWNFELKF